MVKVGARHAAARALEILLGNDMMRSIARAGRYRVRTNDPLAVHPPDPLAGRTVRFIELIDYASDRSVSARVDLDRQEVALLRCVPAGARLAPAEEDDAIALALADRRVAQGLSLGDRPQSIVHVGPRAGAPPHRSAAVTFGARRRAPSLVAVVDLARRTVTRVLPPDRWS